MMWFKTQLLVSFTLCVAAILTVMLRHKYDEVYGVDLRNTPYVTKETVIKNCDWVPRKRQYAPNVNKVQSRPLCKERVDQRKLVAELLDYMDLFCTSSGHSWVAAINFDVPYKIGYLKTDRVKMINPVFESGTGKKNCSEYESEDRKVLVVKKGCYETVTLSYEDDTYNIVRNRTFIGPESCSAQSMMDEMHGI